MKRHIQVWGAATITGTGLDSGDVPSDHALLAQARTGRAEAWDILIERYDRLVYSVAVRNGLSTVDAVDVVQLTFMSLFESAEQLRAEEGLASWLMTVARRQSWRVRNRRRREIPTDPVIPRREEPALDWESVVSVHDALQRVGSPCRELMIALYFDPAEPTYGAIARRMDRAAGGIGPLRGRCLERLRAILDDSGWT